MNILLYTILTIVFGTAGSAFGFNDNVFDDKTACCRSVDQCCVTNDPCCTASPTAAPVVLKAGPDDKAGNACCVKRAYCCSNKQACCRTVDAP